MLALCGLTLRKMSTATRRKGNVRSLTHSSLSTLENAKIISFVDTSNYHLTDNSRFWLPTWRASLHIELQGKQAILGTCQLRPRYEETYTTESGTSNLPLDILIVEFKIISPCKQETFAIPTASTDRTPMRITSQKLPVEPFAISSQFS